MARRTRRNLSNPKIKRIVKHQIHSSKNQISIAANSAFNKIFNKLVFWIFILAIILMGYSLIKDTQFLRFDSLFSNFTSSQNQTEEKPDNNTNAVTSEENTKTEGSEITNDNKTSAIEPVQRKIQVEVLNACGKSGIAATVTKYLRDNNIDVVNMGNHTRFDVKKSILWQRVDKTEPSEKVAELLGLSTKSIESKIDPNLQLDVTIILGEDYKTLKPFND